MKLRYFFYTAFLFFQACATKPPVNFPSPVEKPPQDEQTYEPEIDYDGLQNFLNMSRSSAQLGYVEKKFPTCEVGYGYSSNRNCRNDYFVLIHFQLLCRDSHSDSYTEALKASDMQPLSGRSVKWTLNNSHGILNLDNQGYGQIKMTSKKSPKYKRLKLNIKNDNLYVKAAEMSKVVTPSNWCN